MARVLPGRGSAVVRGSIASSQRGIPHQTPSREGTMNENTAVKTPARSRKRLIVPLAGLLVAAAITVGSGADFVANSVNSANAFSTGTLTQSNSKSGSAIFNASNLKPGDTLNGTVTI